MKAHQDLNDFGNRILTEARTELYLAMRFMGRALDSLGYTLDLSTQRMGTDARTIHYNPSFVFHLFIESPQKLDRLYLHIVLHCIFRHMFTSDQYEDKELWDLASDIQVESVLDSMDYDIINRPAYPFREEWYEKLKSECKVLTAERIYHYLKSINLDIDTRLKLHQEFYRCDHRFWKRLEEKDDEDMSDGTMPPEMPEDMKPPSGPSDRDDADDGDSSGRSQQGNQSGTDSGNQDGNDTEAGDEENNGDSGDGMNRDTGSDSASDKESKDNGNNGPGGDEPFGDEIEEKNRDESGDGTQLQQIPLEELDENWKDTAERLKTELETFGAEAGDETGSLAWVLSAQYRKETDFREFLRKLTVVREETRIDPESFDYGYYNYGMEVYGNMPLIEENEFCEDRRISDLVIVIDTSASTKQEQVQKFLNETAALLRNRTSFFKQIRVHIVECDDQIQKDVTLMKPEEIEEYAEGFQIKGGYGTDFRPAFSYVEDLRKRRELPDMKGMLYFTDGYGEFPEKAPDYDTAFVFDPLSDINDKGVPDWAMKLYLKE
ncbi:Putative metallopeptidase domain-containing protein [Oribacterium sp. WCC10]|nr:Putative metallopeptidase domain-containing protein [Oribacterium sp. WCC10]